MTLSRKTTVFHREISPYHILTLIKKKLGILNFIFGFSGVIDPDETGFDDFRMNISANTKPYATRLYPVNQGPRWGGFMKKN
jgi:hypothetical protein